ncbi:MAG: histidine kinase [Proteobacteria bacterium]|nr:histidine kinase [Pseudomonadota bacterium]MBS0492984.1 histidine kinase [Pseudomonadota bacterium]
MNIDWRSILRHLLQVVAFCCVVAVFTTAIWPNNFYLRQAVNALCIGLVTWGTIEFGSLLVPARHCHPGAGGGHGWPKGWRGVLLAALGIGAGFRLGDPLSCWITGERCLRSTRDQQIGLLITIAAGAVATFFFYSRGQAKALLADKAAAERDASAARLALLQSQLEPHMLFNTLANLRALIATDPAAALQMLDRLDAFLRATLSASRATTHPLAAEFDRLADYLALMAVRMGPRLQVRLALPEALRALPVPPLLLQPLVENAIKHGLEPQVAGGHIAVLAARDGGALTLTVQDNGSGFDASATQPSGHFGLAQVRERIATAYGEQGRFDLQSTPGAGTTVCITLPITS